MIVSDAIAGLSKPRLAGFALAGLVLTLLVIATVSWNQRTSTAGRGFLALFPDDPDVTFAQSLQDLRTSQGRAMPQILTEVDHAAQLDPLDGHSLFFHGFAQVLRGEQPDVSSLEAARQRSPRMSEPRLLLLDAYGRSGRVEEAAQEAQALMALRPQQRSLVVRLLAGLAGRAGGEAALSRSLPGSNVRGPVMLRLAQTGTEGAKLVRLAQPMRGLADDVSQREWIGQLIGILVERGDEAAARALWATLYDTNASQVGRNVANPEFEDEGVGPPFGWSLPRSRAGVASISNGTLEVFYYGSDRASFVSQTLALPPGAYVLQSRLQARGSQKPEGLFWQVSCTGSRDLLLATTLASFIHSGPETGMGFVVPETACGLQRLELAARPTEAAGRQEVAVQRVTVEPVR